MLIAGNVAFGDIETAGDWSGEDDGITGFSGGSGSYTGAYAWADSSNTTSWSYGDGWYSVYTTETALLNWSWSAYAYALARHTMGGGTCASATAVGSAQVNLPWQWGVANFDVSANSDTTNPASAGAANSDQSSQTRTVNANRGIQCSQSAATFAMVDEGTAYAHGCTYAFASLW
jgi:hypothetical protein